MQEILTYSECRRCRNAPSLKNQGKDFRIFLDSLNERPAVPCLIFSGHGCFMNFLALKIDVDTLRGTLEGVPPLVSVLQKYSARATFLF
ncbi:MAG: hypothetical protein ACYDB9_09260, partial [Gammaproteobacteria bacterium]